MKILRVTGLFFLIAGMLIVMFSCAETGSSGPDYSAVSVEPVVVADISGSIVGTPVATQQEFEDKILGPLGLGALLPSASASQMLSSVVEKTADARVMTPYIDESVSENVTIDLAYDIGSPFTGGNLTASGSYDIYGEMDDAVMKMTLDITADFESTLTNAEVSLDTDSDSIDDYIYTASGMANANILADFAMEVTGVDPNGVLEIDLDYGVAFSLGFIINVDDRTVDNEDVGAIVIMDLRLSKSNHNDYSQADYPDFNDAIMAVVNDSIPSDGALIVTVYDNSRNLVFSHSYDFAELAALM